MRFPHHVRMTVTRRDEKELRLGAFIARGIAGAAAPGMILVLARSLQSPVVRSVCTLAGDVAAARHAVRLILAKAERGGAKGSGSSGSGLDALRAATSCEVRRARNPRLIEAHEQLVIGARVCWTGDTMRRDPSISDAYESFVEDCPGIAASAAATFERLWGDCEVVADLDLLATAATTPPKAIVPPAFMGRRT